MIFYSKSKSYSASHPVTLHQSHNYYILVVTLLSLMMMMMMMMMMVMVVVMMMVVVVMVMMTMMIVVVVTMMMMVVVMVVMMMMMILRRATHSLKMVSIASGVTTALKKSTNLFQSNLTFDMILSSFHTLYFIELMPCFSFALFWLIGLKLWNGFECVIAWSLISGKHDT